MSNMPVRSIVYLVGQITDQNTRIRRVKCDETKPECLRCIKFGGEHFCNGYESQEKVRKPPGGHAPVLLKAPTSESFESEDEFQCLKFYAEETAPGLSGILGGGFWPYLLLQTGHRQPFIQHATITIGALSKIFKLGGVRAESSFAPRMGISEDEVALQRHYLFALQQYHKFIRGTRAYLSAQESDKRVVLISCLLVTCIERLQNHKQSSLTQARSGLKIMQQWIEDNTTPEVLEERTSGERGWSIASVPGISSPAPHIIEDDIVQQFRRLELTSLALNNLNPGRHRRFNRDEEAALSVMPPTFTDIEDARLYLELILGRAYHFMTEARRAWHCKKPIFSVRYSDEDNPAIKEAADLPEPSGLSPDELDEEQQIHAAANKRWDDAFQHLFRHLQKSVSASHPDLLLATLLKIRSLSLSIRLAGATCVSELVYDRYASEFQKIISLARPMVENSQNFTDGSFCFDQGFIYELVLVALTCRDRALRREAIELLETKDWREGIWGSKRVADGARFILETEEESVETEFIPETARARLVRMDVDVEKRQAYIQCVQGIGTAAVLKSTVRDWSTFY